MILASIEGTILAIIVGIVMVVVRWISERTARQQAEQEQRNRQERRSSAGPVKPDSEEERMRRFMEALGIPADAASTPPPPPPVRQPPVRREPTIRPVPPIVMRDRPEPRRESPVPPPIPQRRQVTPPPAPAPRVESRPAAPEFPPLQVEMPQLPSFAQEAFQTTSSSISAIPEDISSKSSKRPEVQELGPVSGGEGELWRTALRTPEALRSAFVLKEILGTPRGLQSGGVAHSFPSL